MKKIFKILGILILVVIVAGVCFVTFIAMRGIPKYDVHVPDVPKVEVTPQRVERGEKIADMLCFNCHYDKTTQKLTGRLLSEAPQLGTIYSKNITNDPEYGIGKWTDAEIIYFIRTGIHPHSGKYVPPYMVKLVHISDEDMRSIVSFLRSDRPAVQASQVKHPDVDPSFLTKFLCFVAFKPFAYPEKEIGQPDTSNVLEYGKYLVLYQMECYACHSADFKTMNVMEPEKSEGFFGGGNELIAPDGTKIKSLNLTSDEETGIGKWTEQEFGNAVRNGVLPNGPALRNPMVPFVRLTDSEIHAMYTYLRTVPKLHNKVDRGI